jgi:hypothetical protein
MASSTVLSQPWQQQGKQHYTAVLEPVGQCCQLYVRHDDFEKEPLEDLA